MSYEEEDAKSRRRVLIGVVSSIAFALVLTTTLMITVPQYTVWSRELSGKAALREAEWSRKIAIQEAEAKMESAKFLAQAEIERAKGVAEANNIIAEGLGGPEGYLRWLWIEQLQHTKATIYIPTEANMPLLEARGTKSP